MKNSLQIIRAAIDEWNRAVPEDRILAVEGASPGGEWALANVPSAKNTFEGEALLQFQNVDFNLMYGCNDKIIAPEQAMFAISILFKPALSPDGHWREIAMLQSDFTTPGTRDILPSIYDGYLTGVRMTPIPIEAFQAWYIGGELLPKLIAAREWLLAQWESQ